MTDNQKPVNPETVPASKPGKDNESPLAKPKDQYDNADRHPTA